MFSMDFARKMGKYLLVILLPAIAWLVINSFINRHYHKLENGVIICHAHPYDKHKAENLPQESHHHTSLEFLLFGLITTPVFLLSIGFLALNICRQQSGKINIFSDCNIPERKSYHLFKTRAPPLISF